jgi:hypothetical protein
MPDLPPKWTFATLAQQENEVLDALLPTAVPVMTTAVAGYEYRGWNLNSLTALIGTRKFKKGFYREPATGAYWGYNVRVKQGSIDEP